MCAIRMDHSRGIDGTVPAPSGRAPKEGSRSIRVLLVKNDHQIAQTVAREFGRAGITVIVAHTLVDARMALGPKSPIPDVVILDPHLPDGDVESLLPVIEASSRQPVTILTIASPADLTPDSLEYRPVVLPETTTVASLLRVVRTLATGYAQPTIRRFVRRFNLSRREAQAVALLSRGLCTKEIAACLNCSEKTIYFHLSRVCGKTGCQDQRNLAGLLFAFACQNIGHTLPELTAVDDANVPDAGDLAELQGGQGRVAFGHCIRRA
jgi:DNA-binding NarL/FixJ family response regulator